MKQQTDYLIKELSKKELHRKYFHFLFVLPWVFIGFFIDKYIPRYVYLIIGISVLVLFIIIELYRLSNKDAHKKIWKKFGHMFKKDEKKSFVSTIWAPIDLIIMTLFFSRYTFICSICIGGFADPIAAGFGMKFGGKKNYLGKTWAGTIAYFISSVTFILIVSYILNTWIPLIFIFLLSAIAALVERYILIFDDNFDAPIIFGFAMEGILFLMAS
jgi:dolichol kinase